MKIFKKIIIVLLIFIAIPLIAALFVNKKYAVEREITINVSKDSVFNYVKLLKNQDYYSVWSKKDPLSKKTYSGTDGTVGFVAGWASKNEEVGTGEQEITNIVNGERIDLALRFKIPFESSDKAYMTTETINGNQTKIKWGFDGTMAYPMNLMIPLFDFEGMLGKDLQTGLENLKVILEK
jgi:hypothetical protein